MLVIGVDPGGTTGVFVAVLNDGPTPGGFTLVHAQHVELRAEQFGSFLEAQFETYRAVLLSGLALVGYERFITPTNRAKSAQPDAIEQSGVLKFLCTKWAVPSLSVVKANAMRIASNEVLREVGWWGRGYTHANDAARCGLWTLAAHRPDVYQSLRWPAPS